METSNNMYNLWPTYESDVLMELPGFKWYLGLISKSELVEKIINTDIIFHYISEFIKTAPAELDLSFVLQSENSEKVEEFLKTKLQTLMSYSDTEEWYEAYEAYIKQELHKVEEEKLLEFYSDIEWMEALNNIMFENIENSPFYEMITYWKYDETKYQKNLSKYDISIEDYKKACKEVEKDRKEQEKLEEGSFSDKTNDIINYSKWSVEDALVNTSRDYM